MTAVARTGGFEGADVDGLDHLAQEFEQAARVCDEVRAACEVIVAASWVFGPFGAAFVAYLKTVVIPWLRTIAEALRLMATVLAFHSQAQRDASSAATSLPSYRSPDALPAVSTQHYPILGELLTVDVSSQPVQDASGAVIGSRTTVDAASSVAGVPLVRLSSSETVAALTDAHGRVTDVHEDGYVSLVLGPGTPDGVKPGAPPGGASIPKAPGADGETGFAYHPPELTIGTTVSAGPTFGDAVGGSVVARVVGLTYGGSGQDGYLTIGSEAKGAVEATGGFFAGTEHWQGETTRGVLGTVDAGAGVGFTGGARVGPGHTNVLGTGGFGLGPGLGVGGYAVQHGPDRAPVYDIGGSGEVDEFTVGGRAHHQSDGR